MSYDTGRDRDVVVVERGGNGLGAILGVIVIALLVIGAWYFVLGPGRSSVDSTSPNDVNVNVQLPSVAPDAS